MPYAASLQRKVSPRSSNSESCHVINWFDEVISCSHLEDVNKELKGILSYVFVLLVRLKNIFFGRPHDLHVFANYADSTVRGFFVIRSFAIHINMNIVFM